MSSRARSWLVKWLARLGYRLKRLSDEEKRYLLTSHDTTLPLPDGARLTLRGDNQLLVNLRRRYQALDLPAARRSLWSDKQLSRDLDLPWFRGDNVYVWQYRQLHSDARLKQYLSLLYVQSMDKLGLLSRLEEDGLFGCWTFRYGERPPVSRDLLDSVNEINFLEEHVGLSSLDQLRILDIGAGYGRLAHRMCRAFSQIAAYDCVDGVAESTFLCDYYLQYRGVNPPARSVPLDELDSLQSGYDLVVNIHSFSECTLEAIQWWLDLVRAKNIPWMMIVPNEPEELLSMEADGTRKEFMSAVERAGYELVCKTPVYADDELRELITVRDHFFLFRAGGA